MRRFFVEPSTLPAAAQQAALSAREKQVYRDVKRVSAGLFGVKHHKRVVSEYRNCTNPSPDTRNDPRRTERVTRS